MDTRELKIVAVIAFIICLFTTFIGYGAARIGTQQEAVDNGVARWTVDSKGNLGFEWINQSKQ
jgi:hypothetical protein